MKKMNKKGFTLIELLAVIVIMGILMLVAIPAMQRYIKNSRINTFKNTSKEYINAAKNAWAAGQFTCGSSSSDSITSGEYYITIDTSATSGAGYTNQGLLETGGKSAWGNSNVSGHILVTYSNNKPHFKIALTDNNKNGYSYASGDAVDPDASDPAEANSYSAKISLSGATSCVLKSN